jgi:hypothetical protein
VRRPQLAVRNAGPVIFREDIVGIDTVLPGAINTEPLAVLVVDQAVRGRLTGQAAHTGEIDAVLTEKILDPVSGFVGSEGTEESGPPSRATGRDGLIEGVSAGEVLIDLREIVGRGNAETRGFLHNGYPPEVKSESGESGIWDGDF